MMPATENFIGNFIVGTNIAHYYLLALGDHFSADGTGVVRCSRAAPAKGLYLEGIHSVRKFYQATRAREKLGSKVCKDSKSVNIDSQTINDSS
jgi:hypothetical protein